MNDGSITVMTVDDDPDMMRIMSRTLQEASCDGFISKPFRGPRLLEEVAKHVARSDLALPAE